MSQDIAIHPFSSMFNVHPFSSNSSNFVHFHSFLTGGPGALEPAVQCNNYFISKMLDFMSYGKGVAEGGRRYFILLRMSERGLLLGNSFVSPVALPDSQKNVFSQIIKFICQNWQMDLSTFSNVFVWIWNVFVAWQQLRQWLGLARFPVKCAILPSTPAQSERNRRRKSWVDKWHYKRRLKPMAATSTYCLSLTSTNLICIYQIHSQLRQIHKLIGQIQQQ